MKVLITGTTGCVGHYVLEALAQQPDIEVLAYYKHREKIFLPLDRYSNVTLVQGDLYRLAEARSWIEQADVLVHLAAGWSGTAAFEINVDFTLELFRMAAAGRCQKVIYVSTASILNSDNRPLKEAGKTGSDYIRSKFEMYRRLHESPLYERTVTLFPTAVFSGGPQHPYAHLSAGIRTGRRWLRWLRFFSLDASFHYIHAYDLAAVIRVLLTKPLEQYQEYVIGQTAMTAGQALRQMAVAWGFTTPFQIRLPTELLVRLILWRTKSLMPWDRFCLQYRHFRHRMTRPEDLGVVSRYPTLGDCVKDL